MAEFAAMEDLDETAAQILEAASRRFIHYGYGKTTMSEIADDCNMSTGNLYRYFPSKLDIAEAFAKRVRDRQLEKLKDIAEDPERSPGRKLRDFLQLKLKLNYERFHGNPRSFELSQSIMSERPHLAFEWEKTEGAVLAEILAAGDAAGDFRIANPAAMAKVVQDAAFRFSSSSIFFEGELGELEAELDEIVDLVLDAYAHRAAQPNNKLF